MAPVAHLADTEPMTTPPAYGYRPPAPKPRRRPTRWPVWAAALLLVLAAPLATWWLVGENPGAALGMDPAQYPDSYDYLVHPPSIDPAVARIVGRAATFVATAAALALAVALGTRRLDWRWLLSVGPLVAAGAVIGIAERVITSAVVGANIGGGMAILFGTPTVLALLAWSGLWGLSVRRGTILGSSASPPPPPPTQPAAPA